MDKKPQKWQIALPTERNHIVSRDDEFLVTKLCTLAFLVWLLSVPLAAVVSEEGASDQDMVGMALIFLLVSVCLMFVIGLDIKKKNPEKSLFPGKFWHGMFFYLSFLIDIGVPLLFFIWAHLAFFANYAQGILFIFDSVSTGFFSLLIPLVYVLMFIHGFPTSVMKAFGQFFYRVVAFGLMTLFNENLIDSLFMFGLFEIAALAIICALFFLAHNLFMDPEGNAHRVFKYDSTMIFVAVLFGVPMLLWGAYLYVTGFLYVFNPTFEYGSYIGILVWTGLALSVLFPHFKSLRNYSVDFYRAIPKD